MLKNLRGKISRSMSSAKRVVAAMVFATILVSSLSGFTFASHTITIADAGRTPISIKTADTNVGKILSKQGIVLNKGDELNYSLSDNVENNAVIEIYRANTVTVSYMGETKTYETAKAQVFDVLLELGIVTDENDVIEPGLNTPVTDGLVISVIHYDHHTVIVQEEVAYEVEEILNTELSPGERVVLKKGQNGIIEYEYDIKYLDGKEIDRKLIRQAKLSDPVTEVVEYCPSEEWELGVVPAFRPTNYTRVERFKATAYDASPMDNGIWAGKTSTGMPLVYGVVAVDPRVIPYGTKMYIESVDGQYKYGFAIAGDCGGAIKGNKVDLFFPSRSTCYQFGRRDVYIYFLD